MLLLSQMFLNGIHSVQVNPMNVTSSAWAAAAGSELAILRSNAIGTAATVVSEDCSRTTVEVGDPGGPTVNVAKTRANVVELSNATSLWNVHSCGPAGT